MLRLRSCISARLLYSTSASPISPLHRLLSAAAASPSPSFAVEDYLVDSCGLTRAQALKASTKLSHLKSPSKPDTVLAFLASLGLSAADVAAVVAKDPRLLCSDVEKTLAPVVTGLAGLGLSRNETVHLVTLARHRIRCRPTVSNLQYCLLIFGSIGNLLRAVKANTDLLTCSLERLLTTTPKRFQAIVACAQGLGVPRGTPMFRHALHAVTYDTEETIAAELEYLKKTFRWSDAEVRIAVSKAPSVLTKTKDMLQGRSDFLLSEMGLEPAYIAHRPAIISYSLEGRLRPRYYVFKFLKENGLLDRERCYYSAVSATEKLFMKRFICPHEEAAPHLAQDYVAACRGEVPDNFIFT
ncbi:unnamed protein product [Alopecurus aequalis]